MSSSTPNAALALARSDDSRLLCRLLRDDCLSTDRSRISTLFVPDVSLPQAHGSISNYIRPRSPFSAR